MSISNKVSIHVALKIAPNVYSIFILFVYFLLYTWPH